MYTSTGCSTFVYPFGQLRVNAQPLDHGSVRMTSPILPALTILAKNFASASVGAVMVPHVRGRPLALHTFPHGVDGDGFFVKNAPRHFPGWITTAAVPRRSRHNSDASRVAKRHEPQTDRRS